MRNFKSWLDRWFLHILVGRRHESSASRSNQQRFVLSCRDRERGRLPVGFYQVVSVAVVTATLDRVAGTVGCTAGTFAIGGALTLPNLPCAQVQQGNTLWLKASGTYTVTATCTIAGGAGVQTQFIGYTTTRGDGGKATWTTATNSTRLIAYNAVPYNGITVQNFTFTNTAGTRSEAVGPAGNTLVQGLYVNNCTFDGFSTAINIRAGNGNLIQNVTVTNSTTNGISIGGSNNSTTAGGPSRMMAILDGEPSHLEMTPTLGDPITLVSLRLRVPQLSRFLIRPSPPESVSEAQTVRAAHARAWSDGCTPATWP